MVLCPNTIQIELSVHWNLDGGKLWCKIVKQHWSWTALGSKDISSWDRLWWKWKCMKKPLNISREVHIDEQFIQVVSDKVFTGSARDLSMDQRMNFGDDITSQLRLAKKHHFNKQEEKRIAQEIELQVKIYLNSTKTCTPNLFYLVCEDVLKPPHPRGSW